MFFDGDRSEAGRVTVFVRGGLGTALTKEAGLVSRSRRCGGGFDARRATMADTLLALLLPPT